MDGGEEDGSRGEGEDHNIEDGDNDANVVIEDQGEEHVLLPSIDFDDMGKLGILEIDMFSMMDLVEDAFLDQINNVSTLLLYSLSL